MQLGTRLALLLALAATAVACFATCGPDGGPPSAQPKAGPPPRENEPAAADAPRPTRERRRAQAALAAPVPTAAEAAVDDELWVPAYSVAAQPTASSTSEPTGRVRVLMLRDGQPFEGGHVCFYPAENYLDAKAWDGATHSDQAHAGLPLYTHFWPGFEPVLGSADGAQHLEERARGVTGRDGVVTLDVRANRSLVPYVRYRMSGIPLVSQPRVNVAAGGETTLTIEAAPMRPLTGRCVDAADRPLAGMWVQAIAPREERPLSRKVETSAAGEFQLEVWGTEPYVCVRAVVPYVAHPLGIHDAESEVPPVPAETTIAGVVPGAGSVEIRMPDAPLVFVEVTTAEAESPLTHIQIEGMVFDPRASAWGRLGGPQYRRTTNATDARRAVVGLPAADAVRPLMFWSWGRTITAVDPRGVSRIAVEIPTGRRVSVSGRGWRETDRLRVVCSVGPPGEELPCIWIDSVLGKTDHWSRDDAPVGVIEFQVVRDGVVVGRARVPAGTGPAPAVAIDLD